MKNAVILASILPCLLIPLSAATVSAEEICRNILIDGFYKKYSRINPRVRDRAMYAELCSLDFEQARNAIKRARQSGDDGSLGLSYGLFNLDDVGQSSGGNAGKGTSNLPLTEDRFRQWKAGYCSKSSEADSSQAADFFMQKAAMENVESGKTAEAWSACMRKREGLACWVLPHAQRGEEVLLNVNWIKPAAPAASQSQAQPEVQYSFLTRGAASKFEGAAAKRILPDGYKLKAGTVEVPITRSVDTTVFASLKVNNAGTEQSCKVFIPGDRDFTLSEPFVNRMKLRYPG